MKLLKRLLLLLLLLGMISVFMIFWCDHAVKRDAENYLYNKDSLTSMPVFNCGLVLGTVAKLGPDIDNPFFTARINAAAELFRAGKLRYLLLSGDNSRESYDEPEMMRQALLAKGVPDSVLYFDYAGFRTFDSVIRCAEVFGQKRFLIISQRFHNERAVYLSRNKELDAYAYNAADVGGDLGEHIKFREYLARVNAWLDLNILRTSPKFLGERIELD